MRPKFWQTKEFKRLEKEWYQRLARSRFEDIECEINGRSVLKQRASNAYRGADLTQRENKQRYFELLGHYLHLETDFKSEAEEFIMEKRAQGVTITQISETLRTARERFYKATIRKVIRKYEAKWQLKRK